eukprot:GDKJ01022938.1.p1 GENE.GDKJ01022938.1~~GDKJ01022938.1.p1  ORF type:complete len:731 (+),score=116.94 GDKJ01022938.1:34-2193(+)
MNNKLQLQVLIIHPSLPSLNTEVDEFIQHFKVKQLTLFETSRETVEKAGFTVSFQYYSLKLISYMDLERTLDVFLDECAFSLGNYFEELRIDISPSFNICYPVPFSTEATDSQLSNLRAASLIPYRHNEDGDVEVLLQLEEQNGEWALFPLTKRICPVRDVYPCRAAARALFLESGQIFPENIVDEIAARLEPFADDAAISGVYRDVTGVSLIGFDSKRISRRFSDLCVSPTRWEPSKRSSDSSEAPKIKMFMERISTNEPCLCASSTGLSHGEISQHSFQNGKSEQVVKGVNPVIRSLCFSHLLEFCDPVSVNKSFNYFIHEDYLLPDLNESSFPRPELIVSYPDEPKIDIVKSFAAARRELYRCPARIAKLKALGTNDSSLLTLPTESEIQCSHNNRCFEEEMNFQFKKHVQMMWINATKMIKEYEENDFKKIARVLQKLELKIDHFHKESFTMSFFFSKKVLVEPHDDIFDGIYEECKEKSIGAVVHASTLQILLSIHGREAIRALPMITKSLDLTRVSTMEAKWAKYLYLSNMWTKNQYKPVFPGARHLDHEDEKLLDDMQWFAQKCSFSTLTSIKNDLRQFRRFFFFTMWRNFLSSIYRDDDCYSGFNKKFKLDKEEYKFFCSFIPREEETTFFSIPDWTSKKHPFNSLKKLHAERCTLNGSSSCDYPDESDLERNLHRPSFEHCFRPFMRSTEDDIIVSKDLDYLLDEISVKV